MEGGAIDTSLEEEEESNRRIPDGGWGWVVVFGALLINIIYDGCSYSFGILFTNLLDYFEDTKSNTAWIGSLFFSVPLLCGPFVEKVVSKIGHRKGTMLGGIIAALGFALSSLATSTWILCLTYGLLSGIGMSFPYFTSGVIVAEYFRKRRGLAIGIVECGAGAGTIVFAPFTEFLISKFGWRGALLILSGIVLNISVCGALFRPLSYYTRANQGAVDTSEQLEVLLQTKDGTDAQADAISVISDIKVNARISESVRSLKHNSCEHIRNRTFLVFSISNFVMYFWYDIPYVFMVDKSVTLGIDITRATLLVTCIGILHMFGNIIYGVLSDRKWVNRTILYGLSIALCGLSVIFMGILQDFVPLSITVGAFGLFSSASEAMCALILVDIMGLQSLEEGYGIIMLLQGVANLVGPPAAGLMCDLTGEFDSAFFTAGTCVILAGCLYTALPLCRKRHVMETNLDILNDPRSTTDAGMQEKQNSTF